MSSGVSLDLGKLVLCGAVIPTRKEPFFSGACMLFGPAVLPLFYFLLLCCVCHTTEAMARI